MSYQPRSTNPYIMEKKLNECVGGGGFDPSVLEEIEAEISVLGSENATMTQDIIDIKGSLNSINDNLTSFHYRVNHGTRQISDDGVNWENFNNGAELLWSNPAPTSDFSAQTVNIDLTNYKAIILVTKDNKNNDYKPRGATYLVKFNNQQIGISVSGGFTRAVRQVSNIDDNGVTIGACQGADANNKYIIPLYIFGLKTDIGLSDYINGTNGL